MVRASILMFVLALMVAPRALAAADYTFTVGPDSTTSWHAFSPSSPDLIVGGPDNPTINLILGKRYGITSNGAILGHPFSIISKASDFNDVVLLTEGGVGSLEGDATINWTDDGFGNLEFTVTTSLLAAMRTGGRTLGYRCDVHTTTMRGDFAIFGDGTPLNNPYPPITTNTLQIGLQTIVTGTTAPLGIVFPNDSTGRAFIYDQTGKVNVLTSAGTLRSTPFLNISKRMINPLGAFSPGSYDERGLTGFALHPNFASNKKVYVHSSEPASSGAATHTVPHSQPFNHQEVISEYTVSTTDTNQLNPATRRELIRIDHPQFNHNGGYMAFGKDGFLYFGMGDGGNGDDQGDGHNTATGNAQNTNVILGKIIRIDVNGNNSANGQYGIPAGNPFASGGGGVKEIFVYGVRNPYAFSFDSASGAIYLGEVGQNQIEEIDLLTTASAGKNLGWNLKEGTKYFDPKTTASGSDGVIVTVPVRPLPTGLLEPLADYDHSEGIAIQGGFVSHTSAVPALNNKYVFGDLGPSFSTPGGRIFFLDTGNVIKEVKYPGTATNTGMFIKGFGQDLSGNIYVCGSTNIAPTGTAGKILKITGPPNAAQYWTIMN